MFSMILPNCCLTCQCSVKPLTELSTIQDFYDFSTSCILYQCRVSPLLELTTIQVFYDFTHFSYFILVSRPATYLNVLQARARSREKSGKITKRERKPPIEKRGITTLHAAGDCATRDVTKKYNIRRTRRQGKTSLVRLT